MPRLVKISLVVLSWCLFLSQGIISGDPGIPQDKASVKKIIVEIDYGSTVCPARVVEVPLVKTQTVLELLERVATVETHPVGEYVFVTKIDGVAGERGKTAWYYTIDGKSPKELAYSKILNDAQRVKWSY
nr:DUF4430 domain-containing protein [Candidatus Omnitrophota bacterium]